MTQHACRAHPHAWCCEWKGGGGGLWRGGRQFHIHVWRVVPFDTHYERPVQRLARIDVCREWGLGLWGLGWQDVPYTTRGGFGKPRRRAPWVWRSRDPGAGRWPGIDSMKRVGLGWCYYCLRWCSLACKCGDVLRAVANPLPPPRPAWPAERAALTDGAGTSGWLREGSDTSASARLVKNEAAWGPTPVKEAPPERAPWGVCPGLSANSSPQLVGPGAPPCVCSPV